MTDLPAGRAPSGSRLLTPRQVAQMFKVDPKTVTRWARSEKLRSYRTPGGHRRYLESDVREFRGDVVSPQQRAREAFEDRLTQIWAMPRTELALLLKMYRDERGITEGCGRMKKEDMQSAVLSMEFPPEERIWLPESARRLAPVQPAPGPQKVPA